MSTDSITNTEYQLSTQHLHVTFASGRKTTFLEVPAVTSVLLDTALDRDAFFSSDIRGKYAWIDTAAADERGARHLPLDELARKRADRSR